MADNTLTMALMGDVPLREFASAMEQFYSLVENLSIEVSQGSQIEWVIDALEAGSAIATVRALSDNSQAVDKVISAYLSVGNALQSNTPIPYSEKVTASAKALTRLLNGKITSLRFETAKADVIISGHYGETQKGKVVPYRSFGTIKGTVQTLSLRRGVNFTLYDAIFDKAITCYLGEGREGDIRDYWGRKVFVTGAISRDAETGKPYSIKDIIEIKAAHGSKPESYKLAKGIWQLKDGETPESATRAARDG